MDGVIIDTAARMSQYLSESCLNIEVVVKIDSTGTESGSVTSAIEEFFLPTFGNQMLTDYISVHDVLHIDYYGGFVPAAGNHVNLGQGSEVQVFPSNMYRDSRCM